MVGLSNDTLAVLDQQANGTTVRFFDTAQVKEMPRACSNKPCAAIPGAFGPGCSDRWAGSWSMVVSVA
jgi:hypothetical protein